MKKAHFQCLKQAITLETWKKVSYYILKIFHVDYVAPKKYFRVSDVYIIWITFTKF